MSRFLNFADNLYKSTSKGVSTEYIFSAKKKTSPVTDKSQFKSSFFFTLLHIGFYMFRMIFYAHVLYIAEMFKTTKPLQTRTRENHSPSEKNATFIEDDSITKSKIQPMYLWVGVGVILTLFLFIAITELFNKAISSKNKAKIVQRCDENGKSANQYRRTLTSQNKEGPSHPPNDVEYAEVNEVAEMQATNSYKAISQERPANLMGTVNVKMEAAIY